LVGLGLGGWIAAELATLEPRRLETLTLVGSPGLRPPHGEIVDQVPISFEAYVRLGFSSDAAFERVIGPRPSPEVVELWDYSREMTTRLTWKPWMFSLQLRHLLPEIRTPTLVVWGSEDRVVPRECGQLYAELLPDARLETVEAGHLVDLEEPARLAKLIEDHAHASVSSVT
jgi:pimeloyl-ACP methyl ester carboxylesterase